MASTTVYIITPTDIDSTDEFAIQPRTFDGPGGVKETTDLTLYGNAAADWGEKFNENFYHLLENFACPQDGGTPIPRDISNKITGQLWFNKTDSQLYVYDGSVWNTVGTIPNISDISGLQSTLDGKVNRAGDTNLSGIHSWPALVLNEGNGNIANGPDVRMLDSGLISVDNDLHIHIGGGSGSPAPTGQLIISRGSLIADGSETKLFRIENDGTLHSMITNYETLVTADDDIPNKKYVDDKILGSLVGFVMEEGNVVLPAGNIVSAVLFSNSYSIASATIGFDTAGGTVPGTTADVASGFGGWIKGGSGEILGFHYTYGSAEGVERLQWSVIGIPF